MGRSAIYEKNLMGKYANCVILNKEHEMFERFWSKKREDLCLAFNDGAYKGEEAIKAYYEAEYRRNDTVAHLLQKRFSGKSLAAYQTKNYTASDHSR